MYKPVAIPNGFTLIELVVVMTVTAIIGAGAVTFISNPTQAYFDTAIHAELTDRADTTLRRMAREIRHALPNSIRTQTIAGNTFLEFIPVKAAGRYRSDVGTNALDDPLDFSASADTFDVLGPAVSIASGDALVIYNLGITGANAYEGSNSRTLLTNGSLNKLSFNGGPFPLASNDSRFYVVSNATSFVCDMTNNQLLMYRDYALQNNQPTSVSALNAQSTMRTLATNLTRCEIRYTPGILQRAGIVTIYLGLRQSHARVNLVHQVNVVNSP